MPIDLGPALIRIAPFIILIAVFALRIRQGKLSAEGLSLRWPERPWLAVILWAAFLAFMLLVETMLFSEGMLDLGGFKHDGISAALRIVGMIVLAPIAEELLFRGLLLNWLNKKLDNRHLAAVLQAALFVAVHNFAWQGDLAGAIGIGQSFIDATLYAYARYWTGSLLTPIAMHATGNAIAVAEMLI